MSLDVGVYPGLPMATYLSDTALSKSPLIEATKESWRSARYMMLNPKAETDAMRMGSALHVAILEPDLLLKMCPVLPQQIDGQATGDLKKKVARAWWARQKADGKIPVKPTEYLYLLDARDEVWGNPDIRPHLDAITDTEITFVWDALGQRWKARMDAKTPDYQLEIKTTHSLSMWPKTVMDFGYHIAAAHYHYGWQEATGEDLPMRWIILKNKGAPDSMTESPSPTLYDMGITLYFEKRREFVQCIGDNIWPRFQPPREFGTEAPPWELKKYEDKYGESTAGASKFSP